MIGIAFEIRDLPMSLRDPLQEQVQEAFARVRQYALAMLLHLLECTLQIRA